MIIGKAILTATALSVDSMAVSLSGSVSLGRLDWKKIAGVALVLASIQTLFLAAGYFAGEGIGQFVSRYGSWIGFLLLLYVGGSMIIEALKQGKSETENNGIGESKDFSSTWKIIAAGVATSIDAAATGASFGLCGMPLNEIAAITAMTFAATALFAVLGMVCGHGIGRKFGRPAKIFAGIVLVSIGVELLVMS